MTTATASSVFDSTTAVQICNRGSTNIGGIFYAAEVYSGIGSSASLVAAWSAGDMFDTETVIKGVDCRANIWTGNAAALTQGVTGAPAMTVLNASVSSQDLPYFTDVTRFAKMTGSRIRLCFINLGHNEGGTYPDGDAYRSAFAAFIDQIRVAQPDSAVVICTQNAKKSPETQQRITASRDRNRQLVELAAAKSCGLVDAFTLLGVTGANTDTDGVHPTAAGSQLWADGVTRFLASS
jgi:lysophospholipase L1-like esterase